MNRPRDQLLAGAALALDQHGRDGIRGIRDLLVDGQHAGGPADDPFRRHVAVRLGRHRRRIARERTRDGRAHLRDVERLADVVEGPRAYRLDGGLERAEAADQHDLARGAGLLERLEDIEPRLGPIQVDVRNHEIELVPVRQVHRLRGGLALLQLASGRRDQLRDQPACFDVVVNDQDASGKRCYCGHDTSTAASAAGSSMVNVVPRPCDVETAIVPPSDVTRSRVMLRPRPVPRPAAFVVTHGSKMRGSTAESMPAPVSRTSILTRPPALLAASVSVPPSGMASSALVTRLSSASSSCASSAATLPTGSCIFRSSATPVLARRPRIASPIRVMTESMRTGLRSPGGRARSSRPRTVPTTRSICSSTMRRRRRIVGSEISCCSSCTCPDTRLSGVPIWCATLAIVWPTAASCWARVAVSRNRETLSYDRTSSWLRSRSSPVAAATRWLSER